tara:strand:+ start:598 stop:819 length:222 start_codon:yes stop_codon:yes gene_type:complete
MLILAGLLTFFILVAFPKIIEWQELLELLEDYSCGDSFGISPNSLLGHLKLQRHQNLGECKKRKLIFSSFKRI